MIVEIHHFYGHMKLKSAPAKKPYGLFKTPLENFIDKRQPLL